MLVTLLIVLVTNIHYLNIQNMSPSSKFSHQHPSPTISHQHHNVTNITDNMKQEFECRRMIYSQMYKFIYNMWNIIKVTWPGKSSEVFLKSSDSSFQLHLRLRTLLPSPRSQHLYFRTLKCSIGYSLPPQHFLNWKNLNLRAFSV